MGGPERIQVGPSVIHHCKLFVNRLKYLQYGNHKNITATIVMVTVSYLKNTTRGSSQYQSTRKY